MKKIETHFGSGSKRYKIWAAYFEMMKNVFLSEADGLIFMDFGGFVVVDSKENQAEDLTQDPFSNKTSAALYPASSFSYIYSRKYFDLEHEHYISARMAGNGEYVWRVIPGHVADARDLIIEEIESEVYKVGYDRVQLLYLKEIIKVLLEGNK